MCAHGWGASLLIITREMGLPGWSHLKGGHLHCPLTKDTASNQMCSHRATTKFATKFQDNDSRVGLYSRLWLYPPYWFQQNKNGWVCWRIWNNWIGVVYTLFHLCRSWGASGEKVAGKGETCPLNSSLWKEFSGLKRSRKTASCVCLQ